MTTDEIIVGKKYRYGNVILLGVGMRQLYTYGLDRQFVEKHLVIIDDRDQEDIGLIMQEGDNAGFGVWESIELLEE